MTSAKLSPSPQSVFAECLGLACALGLVHGMWESTLLEVSQIRPSTLDLVILVLVPVVAAALLGVCLAIGLLAPRVRTMLGMDRDPLSLRRTAFLVFSVVYLLVFLKIVSFEMGKGLALVWSLAPVPSLLVACFVVFRKGHRVLVPVAAFALLGATLCAAQLAEANWGHPGATPGGFTAKLLIPVGLCLVALLVAAKTTSSDRPFEPITRAVAALALCLAAWAGFWVNLSSERPLWHVFGDSSVAGGSSHPNVLLIVLDTVRADHLDLFGYQRQTMPNLKRFAVEEAQVAQQTFTPGSWTLPSHASIFTGKYPSAHGAHYPFVSDPDPKYLAYSLPENVTTLAEFLGAKGYATGGIASNYAMLSQFGLSRGFQHYDAIPGASYFAPKILWSYRFHIGLLPSLGESLRRSLPAVLQDRSRLFSVRDPYCRRGWEINSLARHWLNQEGSRPFFLFLNYMDAHAPFLPIPRKMTSVSRSVPGRRLVWFPDIALREFHSRRRKVYPAGNRIHDRAV